METSNFYLGFKIRTRWLLVALFAIAMAWVESAVVFYLRTLIDRINPYQNCPLPVVAGLERAELVREAATLLMIFIVGCLAGRSWRSRLGYAAIAFGFWDIFYYVFLNVMTGWPTSIFQWDILFLLPLPWWGPVWSPVCIALLMISWGMLASEFESPTNWKAWLLNLMGILLALYVFMADSLRVLSGGEAAIREVLPKQFNTSLFCVSLVLMAAPSIEICARLWLSRRQFEKIKAD